MLKKINFAMMLIVLSSMALAADFSGYKYSEDKFTVGDDEFLIRLSNDEEVLVFKSDLEMIGVHIGECESTKYYKYCFNHTIVDFDNNLGKLHDYTGEEMPAIKIMMTDLRANIKVTRSVTSSTPTEYEPVQISVTMKNEGKKPAQIWYTENVSELAEAYSCKDCTIVGNQVKYIATIYPADEKIFSYYLNAGDLDNVKLSPLLEYKTEINNGTISVSSISITPKKSFIITYSGNKNPVIEDTDRSAFVFKNNDENDKLTFSSTLIFDDDLVFASTESGVKSEDHRMIFSGTLDPSESKEFTVDILGKISGKKVINLINDYSVGSDKLKSNSSFEFEVTIQKPKFDLVSNTNIYSDLIEEMEFNIDNSESVNSFKDMQVHIELPEAIEESSSSKTYVIEETFIIPFLKFSRELNAYKKDFIMLSESKKTVEAKATIDYKTMYDEELSQTLIKKITLNPISSIVSIEHNVEDYKQDEGSLLVSTFIKNNDDQTIVFNISETMGGAQVLTLDGREIGDYSKLTKVDYFYVTQLSKKQAFSYMIKEEESNTANLRTVVVVQGYSNVYNIIFNSIIDFEKKTITLKNTSVEKIESESKEELNESGVLNENIELEETHTYSLPEEETVLEEEKPDNSFEVSTKVNGETPSQQNTDSSKTVSGKKSFWDKIVDIFKTLF